jgi:hypothetical protein
VTTPNTTPREERYASGSGRQGRLYFGLAVGWLAALAVVSAALWTIHYSYFFLTALAVALLVVGLARYGRRVGLAVAETLAWAAVVLCLFVAVLVLPLLALPAMALLAAGCRRKSRKQSIRYRVLHQTWYTSTGLRRVRWGLLAFLAGVGGWALSFEFLPHTNPLWWLTSAISVVTGVVLAGRFGVLVFVQESSRRARNVTSDKGD